MRTIIPMFLMATMMLTASTLAVDATTKPSTAPTTQRTILDVQREVGVTGTAIQKALEGIDSPDALANEMTRAKVGVMAIAPLQKMVTLLDEAAMLEPRMADQIFMGKIQTLGMLSLLGDKEGTGSLQKMAQGTDKAQAIPAQAVIMQTDWLLAGKEDAKQAKVVDSLEAFIKANPEHNAPAMLTIGMSSDKSTAVAIKARLVKIINEQLKGPAVDQYKAQVAAEEKMKSLENKPLTIAGVTMDGKQFSSDQLKGKVILVDFWASWCNPCMAELPQVIKVYKEFHGKGLEVLGVSCDQSVEDLKKCLAANPEMVWLQLFDASKPGKHALVTEYGINSIPTMFLIDKKGVVRSVSARDNYMTEIPKLLEEK